MLNQQTKAKEKTIQTQKIYGFNGFWRCLHCNDQFTLDDAVTHTKHLIIKYGHGYGAFEDHTGEKI